MVIIYGVVVTWVTKKTTALDKLVAWGRVYPRLINIVSGRA